MKWRGKLAALILSFALVMSVVCPAFAASGEAQGELENDTEIAVLAADPTPVWSGEQGPYSFYVYAVTEDDEDASEGLEKIDCSAESNGDPGPDEKHEVTLSFTLREGYNLVKVTDSDGKTVSGPDSSGAYNYTFSGTPGSSCILYIVLEPVTVAEPDPEPEPDPVDKSVLEGALEAAEELDADQFTAESWSRLESVISSAKALIDDDSATQDDVDDMVSLLQEAISSLEYAEDSSPDDEEPGEQIEHEQLEGAVEAVKALDESLYTEESWSVLQSALAEAEEILENEDATQVDITVAYITLLEAVDALETVPGESSEPDPDNVDKSGLAAIILEAGKLEETRYTSESWSVLQSALTEAEEILNDEDATQAEVDEAVLQLSDALENLVEEDETGSKNDGPKTDDDKIGREQLEAAVETVKALDGSQYTEESWARLQTALNAAEETLENVNSTEEEYTAAYTALQQAVDTLEPVDDTEPVQVTEDKSSESEDPVYSDDYSGDGISSGSGSSGSSSGGSAGSSAGNSSVTSPQTDDTGSSLLWSILAAAGLSGCAVSLVLGKRYSGKRN